MLTKPIFPLLLFLAVVLLVSCANLKEVTTYASSAVQGIGTFEDISYSFTTSCHEQCMLEQLQSARLLPADCNCRLEQQADSVTLMLYNAARGYFNGLARLSANSLTNYSFDALSKSLTTGSFGGVQINPAQVQSYTKISSVLTRALTDGYRQKKLATYVAEANDAIKTLLEALQFTLQNNLAGRLETKRSRLRSYYFDLSRDSTVSAYEQKKIVEEYTARIGQLEETKKQIQTYARGLSLIAQGHQKLYNNRNKLTVPRLREELTLYASNIQDIMAELNKLKNQN